MPKAGDHIFIVGGTSGLGFSLAQAAHALGAKVTIAGRGAERAAELARSIGPRASAAFTISAKATILMRTAREASSKLKSLMLWLTP